MANNLNPQQFGKFVPSIRLETQSTLAGRLGGSDQSTVSTDLGQRVPRKVKPVPTAEWRQIAARLGHGLPN